MKKLNISEFIQYSDEKFTKRVMITEGQTSVFLLNFQPGHTLPAHKHPGADLQLLVIEGEGTFTVDEKDVPVSKGDVVFLTGDEMLSFANTGNTDTSLYVVLHKI